MEKGLPKEILTLFHTAFIYGFLIRKYGAGMGLLACEK
jgi:hypothetical protein